MRAWCKAPAWPIEGWSSTLGGLNLGHEAGDLAAQLLGLAGHLVAHAEDLLRELPGAASGCRDLRDVLRDRLGAGSGLLDVAGDLARRRFLLFRGRSHRGDV